MADFDVEVIRSDFPILGTEMNGKPLVYLDSAATSQKPLNVINAIDNYYKTYNANIHRGIYKIAEEATETYIESKRKIASFLNAESMEEIIYVRNCTEAINIAALTYGEQNIQKGDHILISRMEHHSNIVPWMMLAKRKAAIIDFIELDEENGKLDMESVDIALSRAPKLVALTQASNVLGTINDVKEITRRAHKKGAKVLIDAAQSTPHMKVDVKDIDSDFFAFSAHKMLGPTGIGVLHAKASILESTEPIIGGGDMIRSVTYDSCTWNDLPWKFEAGTSDISGGIAFGHAVDYLNNVGMDNIRKHEMQLADYALDQLNSIKGVKVFGLGKDEIKNRGGVLAFTIDGVHPHDVAQIFDSEGIAIRAGHHCAMPLVTETLGVPALSRISFYLYNKESEIDAAVNAINKVKKIFMV